MLLVVIQETLQGFNFNVFVVRLFTQLIDNI